MAHPSARWEPSRSVVAAVAVLVVLVVVATAWWYLSSQAPSVPVAAAGTATPAGFLSGSNSATPAGTATSATAGPSVIVVDVAGKVVHPGVYRLPAGSRVVDALRAAGGAAPGVSTTSLNLASPLHDGDQVVVGVPGAGGITGGSGAGGAVGSAIGAAGGTVNLNSATEAQLDALPGVGPVLAQHILDWRAAHGGFTSIDQLQSVSGIGDAKFADLKPLVSV